MPLTPKGEEIMHKMKEEYGEKKGESVFYASENKGTITGVHDIGENPSPGGLGGDGVTSTADESYKQAGPEKVTLQEINERNRRYWDTPGGSMFENE